MALSPTDAEIRTALASAIGTAAPLAKVFGWWILGAQEPEWPGYLRSDADVDASSSKKRVHGYIVTRSASTGAEIGNRCVRREFQYTILGFHYYSSGTSAANSETTFATEIDAITAALDDRASLDTALARIQPITWSFDLKSYGGELLHIARGLVTVQACY